MKEGKREKRVKREGRGKKEELELYCIGPCIGQETKPRHFILFFLKFS